MLNAAWRDYPATPPQSVLSFDDDGVYVTHVDEAGKLDYFAAIRHSFGAYTVRVLDGDTVRENRHDAAVPNFRGIYSLLLETVPDLVGIGLS